MARSTSREQFYKQRLEAMGVYDPGFDDAIKELCKQERERSRATKKWYATVPKGESPSISHPLYAALSKLRRDIFDRQDKLGLTVTGMLRIRRQQSSSSEAAPISGTPNQGFAALMDSIREASHAGK